MILKALASLQYLRFSSQKNPEEAVKMLRAHQDTEDPYAMIGAWATSAIKNLKSAPTSKHNRTIKQLATIDHLLKSTKFSESLGRF